MSRIPNSRGDSSDRSDFDPDEEEEEDVEVDVEECSETESGSGSVDQRFGKRSASECASDLEEDRESPGAAVRIKARRQCNCQELLSADCHLETKELWDKFHDLGTEMIITKTGRWVVNILNLFW